MASLLAFIFGPLLGTSSRNDDSGSVDVVWLMTVFFALGIWLVFRRYEHSRNKPVPFSWKAPEAAQASWTSLHIANPSLEAHLLNPLLLPPSHFPDRKYITCYDPATAQHLGTLPADSAFEIADKIEKAKHAQLGWKTSTWRDRRRFVRSLMKWLVNNRDVCAKVASRDTGKTMIDAAFGEILTTLSKMEWLLKHGERVLRPEKRSTNLMLSYKSSKVHYEPLGVVAAIVSWNYPLHNALSPILAALFAGNSIVVKCSEQVVWSTTWYIGAVKECLSACGYDPDLVQLVCCWPEEAEALTTSPFIKHITFIGSETVGRKVAMAATVNLTPVTLELGGKDPAIILPGTDIDRWASIWMRGVYQNSGQNCIGIERFIVHTSQYADLVDALAERAHKLRLGSVLSESAPGFVPPVDTGSMISSDRFGDIERVINEAVDEGATIETGGKRWKHAYHEEGAYFAPTVIGNVHPQMEIAQHELFAPVAAVLQYETIEEAIDIANGTRYGLGASVFGPDQGLCMDVAKKLECGMVAVNDFGVFYLNQDLPFGGVKASGYGRFGGPEGLRGLTNPKAITVDRWPWLVQTSIPRALDYPIRSFVQSWEFVSGLVGLMYSDNWRDRISSLIRLTKAGK